MTDLLPQLAPLAWTALGLAAILFGISKTALPGINTIGIAAFAAILPAKESTGAVLLLLIVGDVFAVTMYRRHADWPTLLRLIPSVVAGLAAGALFLALADDSWVRRMIGVILLLVIALTLWRRSPLASKISGGDTAPGRFGRFGYGSLGGFTTMVANAAGPVMSMYFLAARFPVAAFLGTAAWFFAVINLVKLPVVLGLGLLNAQSLMLVLVLIPGVVIGAFLGRWIASRIRQRTFEWAVIVCTVLGAIYLLL